jgi:hypothetical protein
MARSRPITLGDEHRRLSQKKTRRSTSSRVVPEDRHPAGTVPSSEASDEPVTRPRPLRVRDSKDIESDWQGLPPCLTHRIAWRRSVTEHCQS